MENNCPVVDNLVIGCTNIGFIKVGSECEQESTSVVYTVEFSFFIVCRIFDESGIVVHLGAGHFINIVLVWILTVIA